MKLTELRERLQSLDQSIRQILRDSEYEFDEDLYTVEYARDNPDAVQLITEYQRILSKLDEVSGTLNYLKQPIAHEGTLHLQKNGRYEVDGVELTCGSPLEILVQDEGDDYPAWVASRIEANNGYYFVARRNLPLEGKRARIRERKW